MKNLILAWLILLNFQTFAQIGINTTGAAPSASAMLDVSSITKGVLIPKMTTAQKFAIVNPAEGLMVYDLDVKQFSYCLNPSGGVVLINCNWVNFGNISSNWYANGNDIVNINGGNVGIGNYSPNAKLDIAGNVKIADGTQGIGKVLTSDASGLASWQTSLTSTPSGWSASGNNIFNTNTNTGNVGIGVTNVQNKLQIGGVPNASGKQLAIGNGTQSMTIDQTATAATFNTNSYYAFMPNGGLATNGNVGIGTDLPVEAKLVVNAATNINISAAFGTNGNGISIQKNWPTISYNAYRDFNNANKYMGTGYGFSTTCDPTTGLFQFNKLGTGTAGSSIGANEAFVMGITQTGNVGIGTIPFVKFHVKYGDSGITPYGIAGFESNTDAFVNLMTPSNYQSGVLFGSPLSSTRGGIIYTNNNGGNAESLALRTGGNLNRIVIDKNGNVAIGDFLPTNKLDVNGTMRAKEVIVETGWADYVFEKNYKLRSIEEMEQFINENKHLPNIPKASEIEKNGLKVGETNKAMMEKIEELAMYVIQLKKEIDLLKSKN